MLDRGRVLAGLGHRPHPQPPTVDQCRQRVDQDPPDLQLSYRLLSLSCWGTAYPTRCWVASRLRSNVDPSLAPNKVKANAERRRREAAQRRSNAIAAPERPQHDPALETALTQVRQRMPSASWPEQVEAAWAIVNEASTDGPKETP